MMMTSSVKFEGLGRIPVRVKVNGKPVKNGSNFQHIHISASEGARDLILGGKCTQQARLFVLVIVIQL